MQLHLLSYNLSLIYFSIVLDVVMLLDPWAQISHNLCCCSLWGVDDTCTCFLDDGQFMKIVFQVTKFCLNLKITKY